MSSTILSVAFTLLLLLQGAVSVDYRTALSKSIVYFEAQRSGKLPSNQRVQWRGDSGLKDGSDSGIDLVGGYYDAGDNVKFGFPLAYTVTMLAWSVIEFEGKLKATNEHSNALNAVRWGTDYLIKAHPQANVLYGQVGDGDSDHECWQRPEDMTTPRTAYKIDEAHPGSDLAGETAAAFAAASIAFRTTDIGYSNNLLRHALRLFDFANNHQGKYSDSIPSAAKFYSSSGYQDELFWAAAWIYRATNIPRYLNYINGGNTGGTRTMFSWDDKYAGVQILVAQFILRGKISNSNNWSNYKSQGEQFICNCIGKGNNNVARTGGGLLWWQPWNNLQYATAALFLTSAYSDTLRSKGSSLQCNGGYVSPDDLIKFVQSQVDYILGANPKGMSYMVGFGSNYPQKIHHRSSSIVSIKKDSTPVTCKGGFDWLNSNFPNPNVVDGAIVGGPDQGDNYRDDRNNFQQSEAATANNAPFVGVLARLA